jgi:hypothetical protein
VGGDEDAGATIRKRLDQVDQVVLASPVHAPCRLVQGDEAGQLFAFHAPRQSNRQRQALALTAGEVSRIGIDSVLESDDSQRSHSLLAWQLVADALADQVVTGILGEQCNASGCFDLAANWIEKASGGLQQGALTGAVTAHKRHAFT